MPALYPKPSNERTQEYEASADYKVFLASVEDALERTTGRRISVSNIGHLALMGYTPEEVANWLASISAS